VTDTISKKHRSWNMSRIRGKDTAPEKAVRSVLRKMRYKMRLNARDLPGRPDIVLPRKKVAIFVHGCFWHRHPRCKYAYTPKTRVAFWKRKFDDNVRNDRRVKRCLVRLGWRVLVIWECETMDMSRVRPKLTRGFAKPARASWHRRPSSASC
jgi:DNA mismatch endonuclease (patch repair protein)